MESRDVSVLGTFQASAVAFRVFNEAKCVAAETKTGALGLRKAADVHAIFLSFER